MFDMTSIVATYEMYRYSDRLGGSCGFYISSSGKETAGATSGEYRTVVLDILSKRSQVMFDTWNNSESWHPQGNKED